MGEVIDIAYYRRSGRLFTLLVERSGVRTFLADGAQSFRLDPDRVEDAVVLAASWLELQTGRSPSAATVDMMRQCLRRILIRALARYLVDTGH